MNETEQAIVDTAAEVSRNVLKENGEELLKNFTDTAYPKAVTKVKNGIYHVMGKRWSKF